jgi:hypothetical protein
MEPQYRESAAKKLQAQLDAHARRLAVLEELFAIPLAMKMSPIQELE